MVGSLNLEGGSSIITEPRSKLLLIMEVLTSVPTALDCFLKEFSFESIITFWFIIMLGSSTHLGSASSGALYLPSSWRRLSSVNGTLSSELILLSSTAVAN